MATVPVAAKPNEEKRATTGSMHCPFCHRRQFDYIIGSGSIEIETQCKWKDCPSRTDYKPPKTIKFVLAVGTS